MRLTAQDAGRDLQARINDARATADRLGLGAGRVRSAARCRPRAARVELIPKRFPQEAVSAAAASG